MTDLYTNMYIYIYIRTVFTTTTVDELYVYAYNMMKKKKQTFDYRAITTGKYKKYLQLFWYFNENEFLYFHLLCLPLYHSITRSFNDILTLYFFTWRHRA